MKKWMITIVMLILAGIALFVFISPLKSHKTVSQQDLRNPDFLDDKEVLLYFSSSADQDAFGDGKSYALFISQDGTLSSFKMKVTSWAQPRFTATVCCWRTKTRFIRSKTVCAPIKEPISTQATAQAFCKTRTAFTPYTTPATTKRETNTVQSCTARWTESGKKTSFPTTSEPPVFITAPFMHSSRQLTKKAISSSRFMWIRRSSLITR